MQRYFIRRLLIAIPTIFGITVLIFFAMRVLPGDPLAMMMGEGQARHLLTEEEEAAARRSLGLDRPLVLQYADWMTDIARGDLGYSFWTQEPIREAIVRRGPISAEIAFLAILLSWLIGVPVGLLSAVRRNSWLDNITRLIVTTFLAIPSFWLGLVMILFFVTTFSWRPPLVIVQLWEDPVRNLQMVLGPAIAIGLGLAATIARMTRSTVLEVSGEDFVRTAWAKGLRERIVVMRHVFRNALLPVITTSGMAMGALLSGTVATETAFGVPGLGTLLVQSLNQRDWMMVQNLVLLYALIFTFINLMVDLSYGWIDPRIRFH